jgi:hypothetical protein
VYQDSLENAQVTIKEGFPKRLRNQYINLPAAFVMGWKPLLRERWTLTLFKTGTVIRFSLD